MPTDWLATLIHHVADAMPDGSWLALSTNVRGLLVVILVSVICGAVGSLVVGNRMSFFSDALAHCAFAGVALGMLITVASKLVAQESWILPLVMVTFGVGVGIAIAFVREQTGLASDTVIGVFFAAAVGFGGMLFQSLQTRRALNPESFLFGSPLFVSERDLLILFGLSIVTALVLFRRYNDFVLSSFNASLASSRRVPLRWCNYLFVVLLALIVNLCLRAVGALLINAMLVVPAATAANLSRNLRQMFWGSIACSVVAGVGGLWISSTARITVAGGEQIDFGPAGLIVVLSVLGFFASMLMRAFASRRPSPSLAGAGAATDNTGAGEPPTGRPS